jgi:RimJ/RimL family protein N-acetyltransferase
VVEMQKKSFKTKNGRDIQIREITSGNEEFLESLISMYTSLSSKTLRFLRANPFTSSEVKEMLKRVDGERITSLVALNNNKVVAEARLIKYSEKTAEFGLIVHDKYQNKGIGQAMVKSIIEACKRRGIKRLIGFCSEKNKVALHIYRKFGFKVEKTIDNPYISMEGRVLRLSITID